MADLTLLQAVAAQLAARVRDDNPEANSRWLLAELPNPADWFRLIFVLAAATPVDQPWSELVAWAEVPDRPQAYPQPPPRSAYEAVRDERFGTLRRGAA